MVRFKRIVNTSDEPKLTIRLDSRVGPLLSQTPHLYSATVQVPGDHVLLRQSKRLAFPSPGMLTGTADTQSKVFDVLLHV